MVSITPRRYASHVALDSSIHDLSSCLEEEMCHSLEDDAEVYSMFTTDGSIVEYKDMIVGLSQRERVAHDVALALGSNGGVDLV
jgi:hypothetical protein